MRFDTLKIWKDEVNGRLWHSYTNSRDSRELSMGPCSTTGTEWGDNDGAAKAIAWAKSHDMTIIDMRSHVASQAA